MPPNNPTPQNNGYGYTPPPTPPAPPTTPTPSPLGPSPVSPTPPTTSQQPYDFIVNPEQAPRGSRIPGGNSKIIRVMLVLGGLLILFVLFSFVKGLLNGESNTPYLLKVVQDQQQLIHLTTNAGKENSLNEASKNFAITTKASVSSSQSAMIGYMAVNGKKIKTKELVLGIDPQTDTQLTASLTSNSYNQTFQTVMKESMNKYIADLQIAYKKTDGKQGKTLLKSDYDQAQLLLIKLESN